MDSSELSTSLQCILSIVVENPGCSSSIIHGKFMEMSGSSCSRATLWRNLQTLLESDHLIVHGNLKGARYFPNDSERIRHLKDYFKTTPLKKRAKITYQPEVLDAYVPNQTCYLSPQFIERLEGLCPPGTANLAKMSHRDLQMFLGSISYGSSALEGVSYGLAETIDLVLNGVPKDDSSDRDRLVIVNHFNAIKWLINGTVHFSGDEYDRASISPMTFRQLHVFLMDGLIDRNDLGTMRKRSVEINDSAYLPTRLGTVIENSFAKLFVIANQIQNPFEQAFFLKVHLSYLQPFVDGNKRTSRVGSNIALLQSQALPMNWEMSDASRSDYSTAMIAFYEKNDPLLLAEIFADSYARSVERFELVSRQRDPDKLYVRYRDLISRSVAAVVRYGDESIPSTVESSEAAPFLNYVMIELDRIRSDGGVSAARHGLKRSEVLAWIAKESEDASIEGNTASSVARPR